MKRPKLSQIDRVMVKLARSPRNALTLYDCKAYRKYRRARFMRNLKWLFMPRQFRKDARALAIEITDWTFATWQIVRLQIK